MSDRIVVSVHGRGRGHAMRALGFVPALRRAGFTVEIWAGGAATAPLVSLGAMRPIDTVAPGPSLVARTIERVRDDRRSLIERRPAVLVSDGDAPSTYAARTLGIPVVAVGHGLLFAFADAGPLPLHLVAREAINALSSSLFSDRQIAVHFADATPRFRTTRLARPTVRPELDRRTPPSGEVVAYFRDGGGDDWLRALAARGVPIRLFSPSRAPLPGIAIEPPDLVRFATALTRARGAVGTAGSNLVAECRHLGIPLLALPAPDDVEQRLNASIGEHDTDHGPLVRGRLDRVDDRAIDRFRDAIARLDRDGRLPDGLPETEDVDEAVVATVRDLLARR